MADAINYSRRVVWFVPGLILPAVVYVNTDTFVRAHKAVGVSPFVFHRTIIAFHDISIFKIACVRRYINFCRPALIAFEFHRIGRIGVPRAQACGSSYNKKAFAPIGAVIDIKNNFHDC